MTSEVNAHRDSSDKAAEALRNESISKLEADEVRLDELNESKFNFEIVPFREALPERLGISGGVITFP